MQLDLGREVGKAIGLMAQLRIWGKVDAQITELGVYDQDAECLERVEKLLEERFKTLSIPLAHRTVGVGLESDFDSVLGMLFALITGRTQHFADQWRLWDVNYSNSEFVDLLKSLDIVRGKRHQLQSMLEGTDFFSAIQRMLDEEFPVEEKV